MEIFINYLKEERFCLARTGLEPPETFSGECKKLLEIEETQIYGDSHFYGLFGDLGKKRLSLRRPCERKIWHGGVLLILNLKKESTNEEFEKVTTLAIKRFKDVTRRPIMKDTYNAALKVLEKFQSDLDDKPYFSLETSEDDDILPNHPEILHSPLRETVFMWEQQLFNEINRGGYQDFKRSFGFTTWSLQLWRAAGLAHRLYKPAHFLFLLPFQLSHQKSIHTIFKCLIIENGYTLCRLRDNIQIFFSDGKTIPEPHHQLPPDVSSRLLLGEPPAWPDCQQEDNIVQ